MCTTITDRRAPIAALWAEAWRVALLAAILVVAVLVAFEAVVAVPFPFLAITEYDRPLRERAAPFTISLTAAAVAIAASVPGHVHKVQAIGALLITALFAFAISTQR